MSAAPAPPRGRPARQEDIGVDRFLNIIRRNAVVPGLVHLYVRLQAEAVARTLMALADGAQAQWLHDPAVDMAGLVAGYVEQLRQQA